MRSTGVLLLQFDVCILQKKFRIYFLCQKTHVTEGNCNLTKATLYMTYIQLKVTRKSLLICSGARPCGVSRSLMTMKSHLNF